MTLEEFKKQREALEEKRRLKAEFEAEVAADQAAMEQATKENPALQMQIDAERRAIPQGFVKRD